MPYMPFRTTLTAAAALLSTAFLLSQTPQTTPTPKIYFSAPKVVKADSNPSAAGYPFLAGDLNGDGNTDLIYLHIPTANNNAYARAIFGNGKGGFTPASSNESFPPSAEMGSTTLVDLNGDGKADIVQVQNGQVNPQSCETAPATLTIYLGNGKGGFGSPTTYYAQPDDFTSSTVTDLNGDGKPDVVLTTTSQNYGDCGGTPAFYIFLNKGDGTFASPQVVNAASIAGLTQARTVLDPEIAAPSKNSPSVATSTNQIAAGDFNGDGKMDLATTFTTATNNQINVVFGDGKGGFSGGFTYTFDSAVSTFAAADLNGDGKADLVVGLEAKNVSGAKPKLATLLAKKNGGFYWAYSTPISYTPNILAFTDFNGDGKLDLLTLPAYVRASSFQIFAGEGGGKFAQPQSFSFGSEGNIFGPGLGVDSTAQKRRFAGYFLALRTQ